MTIQAGEGMEALVSRPLRLLWLAPYGPWPEQGGGRIRMWEVVSGLASHGVELHVYYPSNKDARPADPPNVPKVLWSPYEGRLRQGVMRKVVSLFSWLPASAWEMVNRDLEHELRDRSRTFDAVVLEQALMAPYITYLAADTPVILIAHNVEHDVIAQIGRLSPRLKTRLMCRLEVLKFRRLERKVFNRAQLVVAMSQLDKSRILKLVDNAFVAVYPNGVDLDFHEYRPRREGRGSRLVMTGTMGYVPNLDAAMWIYHEILPGVRRQIPDASISLVGSCPNELRRLHDPTLGFEVIGFVEDVRPHMQAADVFLMPLRMGGGTRLKALEAMSAGVPIVSTSLGVEGLDLGAPPAASIGETADELIELCVRLLNDSALRQEQSTRARALVEENYSWTRIVSAFHRDLICLLNSSSTSGE
jgi:glycosyltransferase involved in cell wall biosynthesis